MKHKPKKGVMPAALKKYWAARRRGKTSSRVKHRARRKNPGRKRGYILLIKKGNQTLRFLGDKFSSSGSPKRFDSPGAVLSAAKRARSMNRVLHSWHFFARTV